MIEEELKTLRLSAGVEGPRDRILRAALTARKDKRIGRWIGGVAAAMVTIAVLAVSIGDRDLPDRSHHSDRGNPPRFSEPVESIQEYRP